MQQKTVVNDHSPSWLDRQSIGTNINLDELDYSEQKITID